MAKVPSQQGKFWPPPLPPSARLLYAAWNEAVFGPQNFKFKDREPTESEKAIVAELKRISGAT